MAKKILTLGGTLVKVCIGEREERGERERVVAVGAMGFLFLSLLCKIDHNFDLVK